MGREVKREEKRGRQGRRGGGKRRRRKIEEPSGEQRKGELGERTDEKSVASLDVGEERRGGGEERTLSCTVTSVACILQCCPSPLK